MLADDIKKKHPFTLPEEEAYLNLWRSYERLSSQVEQQLKPFGLSQSSYNVLRILARAGVGGMCTREIGSRLVARVPDVTRLVDRLASAKLVRRQSDPSDRRIVRVAITPAGTGLLKRLEEPLGALMQRLLGHMKRAELEQLSRLLEEARRGAAGGE